MGSVGLTTVVPRYLLIGRIPTMKIARIKDRWIGDTYAIVSDDLKKLITRSEIQEQTGIPIPSSIKEFMFKGWLN